jgi:hypothetical protein
MELVSKGVGEKGVVWVARRVPDDAVCSHANQVGAERLSVTSHLLLERFSSEPTPQNLRCLSFFLGGAVLTLALCMGPRSLPPAIAWGCYLRPLQRLVLNFAQLVAMNISRYATSPVVS